MLNTAYEFDEERPVPPDEARVAAHGDTGLFIGCPDVDAAYEELRAKGVEVKKPHVAPYGMKQMSPARSGRVWALLPVGGEEHEMPRTVAGNARSATVRAISFLDHS